MCKVLLSQLLEQFEFRAPDGVIEPSTTQMGGVSRASQDVILDYLRKRPA
jgi:hypothetical protein